jgi:hypothetical protein
VTEPTGRRRTARKAEYVVELTSVMDARVEGGIMMKNV